MHTHTHTHTHTHAHTHTVDNQQNTYLHTHTHAHTYTRTLGNQQASVAAWIYSLLYIADTVYCCYRIAATVYCCYCILLLPFPRPGALAHADVIEHNTSWIINGFLWICMTPYRTILWRHLFFLSHMHSQAWLVLMNTTRTGWRMNGSLWIL